MSLRERFTENAEQFDTLMVEMLAENDRLRAMLAEAADCISSCGSYASEYFQEKHDLQGDIKRFTEAAKNGE